jgi:hypothetical protein
MLATWRSRRSEKTVLDIEPFNGRSAMQAPGRAWCWKAFSRESRADGGIGIPGEGEVDSAVVYAFVRRALLAVTPSELNDDGIDHPICKYRVTVSILDSEGDTHPGGPITLSSDSTGAERAVSLATAEKIVSSGAGRTLPHLPIGVPGLNVVSWHESLSVATNIIVNENEPPPILLRVCVLAEVIGDSKGGSYHEGDELTVIAGIVGSVDLGISAPGKASADPTFDPTHYRLHLRWPQPPPPMKGEVALPAFPIAFLELDLRVERRGWAAKKDKSGALTRRGDNRSYIMQLRVTSIDVQARLPGADTRDRRSRSPRSPHGNEGSPGSAADSSPGVNGLSTSRTHRSPEREASLSPSKGVGNIGFVSKVDVPRKLNSRSIVAAAREGWSEPIDGDNGDNNDQEHNQSSSLPHPGKSALDAHTYLRTHIDTTLEAQAEGIHRAEETAKGFRPRVDAPREVSVITVGLVSMAAPRRGDAKGLAAAAIAACRPPRLLELTANGPFIDAEAGAAAAEKLAPMHTQGVLSPPILAIDHLTSGPRGATFSLFSGASLSLALSGPPLELVIVQIIVMPVVAISAAVVSLSATVSPPSLLEEGMGAGIVLALALMPVGDALSALNGSAPSVEAPLSGLPLYAPSDAAILLARAAGGEGIPPPPTPIAYLSGGMTLWDAPGSSNPFGHAVILRETATRGAEVASEICIKATQILHSAPPQLLTGTDFKHGARPQSVTSIMESSARNSLNEEATRRNRTGGVEEGGLREEDEALSENGQEDVINADAAARAAAAALLASNPRETGTSQPLVARLVAELDRRTLALRTCGSEIVRLRRDLRLSRDELGSVRRGVEEELKAREAADDAVLAAALRDLGPALLDAPAGPGPGLSALAALSAQQLLQALRAADPTGARVVPTLLRRLAVVAHKYVQQRKANAALASEAYVVRTRARLMERDMRSLSAAAVAGGGVSAARAAATALDSLNDGIDPAYGPLMRGGPTLSSLDAGSTSRSMPAFGATGGPGSLDSVAGALLAAEAAMGMNLGGLAPGDYAAPGSFVAAIAGGTASVDPSAPVSALAHARLLDQYASVSEALTVAREDAARQGSELRDVREAAARQAAMLQRLQARARNDEALRNTVKAQQDMVRKMESACDQLTARLGDASTAQRMAEKRARTAEKLASAAAARADETLEVNEALANIPRLDPSQEGHLRAELAASLARAHTAEEQLVQSSVQFSENIETLNAHVAELETEIDRRDVREGAAGRASLGLAMRAAEDAARQRAGGGGSGSVSGAYRRESRDSRGDLRGETSPSHPYGTYNTQRGGGTSGSANNSPPLDYHPHQPRSSLSGGGGGGGGTANSSGNGSRGAPRNDTLRIQSKGNRGVADDLDVDLANIDNLLNGMNLSSSANRYAR